MTFELNTTVVLVLLIGAAAVLVAAEILLHVVWRWATGRRRQRTGRYPWSERTGL
jgi:peptidoglycan/LPS O-acetylase OafA/YrhL